MKKAPVERLFHAQSAVTEVPVCHSGYIRKKSPFGLSFLLRA